MALERHEPGPAAMSATQFLDALTLGQITPGPVAQTVAAVGYAAAGVGGGLLAAAFAPSLFFILIGAPRFDALRHNARAQAFMTRARPAAIGCIAGAALPLALGHRQPRSRAGVAQAQPAPNSWPGAG